MKIYIVADMEGISGVVDQQQISGETSWDADRIRRQFTEEICAVCAGALEGGAEEIIINDFHGNGRNVLAEKLPREAFLVQGGFRQNSGFDMLDNTYGGFVFLGAHSRTGTREGLLPHTYTKKVRFEILGQQLGEAEILAFLASESNVPTLLISGDSKTIEQAHINLPSTHSVVTKFALGYSSALCFHPANVLDSLREEMKRAIKNAANIEVQTLPPPIDLIMHVNDVELTERLEWIPQVKRVSDTSFEFVGESMRQIARLIYGVTILVEADKP